MPPAGSFGVPKDELFRATTKRMGRNASELAMRTANLLDGSMFCDLTLRPGQYCRVNLDDLPDYFHNLREGDRSALRNHLGKPYSAKALVKAGFKLSPGELKCDFLQLVLCALPMGSTHAVDLA